MTTKVRVAVWTVVVGVHAVIHAVGDANAGPATKIIINKSI